MKKPPGKHPVTPLELLTPDWRWLNRSVKWKAIVATLAVCGVAVAMFVVAGGISISADEPDGMIARNLLHFVFNRSVSTRARGVVPPDDLTAESRVKLAAQHFDMVCANCHGGPGIGQSVTALSMSPRPQNLPKVVGQFTDAELYMIVMHGVKFSAMPSWANDTRNDEVWSMVAFLRQLPKLDATSYLSMTARPETPAGAPKAKTDAAVKLRAGDVSRNTPPEEEFLYAAPAMGFGDEGIRATPAATCARCHGEDGTGANTGGEAPNLTIHDAAYLRQALEAYSNGKRKSGFMQTIAAQLSGDQIGALANYYAGLPVKALPPLPADSDLTKRGEEIAVRGIKESATPACANCHEGPASKLTGAPPIAGQSAVYLRRQLGAMRLGGRGSTTIWNPMAAEAHNLTDKDIAALAAFYSAQQPTKNRGDAQVARVQTPQGDLAAAKAIFQAQCEKCHANGGRGDPQGGYPNLTIQTGNYALQALHAFRARTRVSNQMLEVTESLNYGELESLAAYINSMKSEKTLVKADADAGAKAAQLAMQGDQARGIPSCLSCHSEKGTTAFPLVPHLQGQSAVYLSRKLDEFAGPIGERMTALNPMPAIAAKLTPQERSDLAAYFATAEPVGKN